MDPATPSAATCQETSGFLFKHPCSQPASATCPACGKAVCHRHLRSAGEQFACTSCAQRTLRQDPEWRSRRRYAGSADYDRDDPYFYGGYHYGGFGYYGLGYWGYSHYHHHHHHAESAHDARDFTEADAQSLTEEGNEGFEQDPAGS